MSQDWDAGRLDSDLEGAAFETVEGDALRQAGVVGGGKCNLETASVLLTLAAGNAWTADRLRAELAALGLTDA